MFLLQSEIQAFITTKQLQKLLLLLLLSFDAYGRTGFWCYSNEKLKKKLFRLRHVCQFSVCPHATSGQERNRFAYMKYDNGEF
jgi:hypothetical protein